MKRDAKIFSLITEDDLFLFNEGNHFNLYNKLGAHLIDNGKEKGACFAVWAPNARQVSVISDLNDWNPTRHPLSPRGQSGIWEGFIPGAVPGLKYKYHIVSHINKYRVDKADPLAFYAEISPKTASVLWDMDYSWNDGEWLAARKTKNSINSPFSIYEVHPGSWRRKTEEGNRSLSYREIAVELTAYVKEMGFTHIELMPVMEHPFYGSWGYQATGFFAPTSRYGTPQDFMYLIDTMHRNGIGVILDWVPSHFPDDSFGLGFFDGTHLYEHEDSRLGIHPEWKSLVFNYGRHEVRSFLISSALFWLEKYHIDGLRVDAVASMLYLDYGRKPGEWIPNQYGGHENLEAVAFIRKFNEEVYRHFPDTQTIAEESTAWPMVSRPTYVGGLGFGLKWDMGWMHDTLDYLAKDPVHRKFHHNDITFRSLYQFTENFVMPLSHDEVVHGKGSLLGKMPGDDWQKFANLRLLLGYMYAEPGKKLIFMGAEIGQWREWAHEGSLDWHLLQFDRHTGIQRWVRDLNFAYSCEKSLHELDCDASGFEWIDANDVEDSTLTFLRKARDGSMVLASFNFTPVPRINYRAGAPVPGLWTELLNSDAVCYGGSGMGNLGGVNTEPVAFHGRTCSISLTLPPLAAVFLKSP